MAQAGNFYTWNGPTDDGLYNGTPVSGLVDVKDTNSRDGARPDTNWSAAGLTAGRVVARSAVDATQITRAADADDGWQGVLAVNQKRLADGVTFDRDSSLMYVSRGLVRVEAGEALADDILWCSDALGRARAWVALDGDLAAIGRTRSSCTAAGETVYATVEGA